MESELPKLPKLNVDMTIRNENMSKVMKQERGSLEETIRAINATLEKMGAGKIVYEKRNGNGRR